MFKRAPIVVMAAVAVVLAVTQGWPVAGQGTTARPEDVGLSTERFQRVNELMKRHIDAVSFSGAVTLVARRGKVVHLQAQGLMDIDSHKAMQTDGIFGIMSMTKPVVGTAILMLMEEGKVRLTDPASKFVPELKGLKVAVAQPGAAPGAAPLYYSVPADHEITIRELLTHTSGLASGPISLGAHGAVAATGKDTLADYVPRLARTPLEFQPGTRWSYSPSAGFDLLLRIVEVASGQPANQFLKSRIFDPLGMKDTSFYPAKGNPRVVTLYQRTPEGTLRRQDYPGFMDGGVYFSGGGGLFTTAQDYLQFAQMLLGGGQLHGKRLLSDRTVALMRSAFTPDTLPGRQPGEGYGLSVRVITSAVARNTFLSDGSFGWSGAYGTHFWVDPKEEIIGIMMVQTPNREAQADFETAVMQTIAAGGATGTPSGTR